MNSHNIEMISGKKMLLQVQNTEVDPVDWLGKNKDDIEHFVSTNGALLIRGLKSISVEEYGGVLESLFGEELATYNNRSTPRTELKSGIYTATEYHASERIPQHNEASYSNSWPMRIGFLCVTPAKKMGNTPISDSRIAYQEIPKEIREEFERKKVMYVRNYSNNIDLPWSEVFQTKDKKVVEEYCKENSIKFEWTADGLRTKQINQATMIHPVTYEKLWFNQAHLFHVSNLDDELHESLLELLGEENLPRNTYFGDGSPIDVGALSIIREVYEKTKFSFQWEKNDLLLLDNMLFTHGRDPYEGPRQILVGMAKNYSAQQVLSH
jgi:alpha-ketoglutarate-dependent taurine dioxygenase